MAGDITKFDADYNKSLQVENSVSGGPLNLKGNPLNNNALYTEATVSETPPDDLSKNNPETILSFNAAKQLIYIDEVIAGTTYRQTVEGTGAKLIDDYVVASTQTFGSAVKV